ncbi:MULTISPECIES: glutathione S-transferase family protein [unclassified Janthinobacterium]|uniref:glutathione S-transferase family protein n=1 Tax=unclassified Janthinobacterium TaxID=2610881 RepID=UPI0018CA4175|nr:glutathione S-transferase family protein [Janthinobacterium sp. CG_23.4]MDH6158599.1 glutathione S-transferase [Janthinobacterium sp. CG_23.4]
MKLYISPRTPNPRRVTMFIAEKGITGIEEVALDLMAGQQRDPAFLAKNPLGRVPVLELSDGRVLTEARAICTYLEGLQPQPNLMGEGFEERAFIEMADRRVELNLLSAAANWARHGHPALVAMENPQLPDFAAAQAGKLRETAQWLDQLLAKQPYIAGDRYTIADITAFCTLEFVRGLMKYRPGAEGLEHLQAYRDRIAARPSAQSK